MRSNAELIQQLVHYKRKYFINKALKGAILFISLLLVAFLLVNTIEFSARLNSLGRGILFYSFILFFGGVFYLFVIRHLWSLKNANKNLSHHEAAHQIGSYFPEVSDKLLNLIQLESLSETENELLQASILQKSKSLTGIPFVQAIDLYKNRRYLKYSYAPLLLIVLLFIFIPQFLTESSTRILNYDKEFVPEAPFHFRLQTESLRGFTNEPFNLKVATNGSSIPQNAYLILNERKIKMTQVNTGIFEYTINPLKGNTIIVFEAEGLLSQAYEIDAVTRPNLAQFEVELDYPNHTRIKNETIKNSGNLVVPEGTKAKWIIEADVTDQIDFQFDESETVQSAERIETHLFSFEKRITESNTYQLKLTNAFGQNKDRLSFRLESVKDQRPQISLEQYADTVLYQNIVLGGQIRDDYGLSDLQLYYKYNDAPRFESTAIAFDRENKDQSFFYLFDIDSEEIKAGSSITYYIQVTDNDGVNGYKSTKTGTYQFKIPPRNAIEEELSKSNQSVQNKIDQSLKEAKELKAKIEAVDESLKTKKELEWQDEKQLQEIIDKKKSLEEKLNQLKKQNQLNLQKQDQFSPQSEATKERMKQMEDIMNNVMDEDTKKLYEEIEKLLEETPEIQEAREKIEQLNNNSEQMEQDLERTLELFKKLQFELELNKNVEKLNEQTEEQEKLNEATEKGDQNNLELGQEQAKEKEETEKLAEEMRKMQEKNQERKNPDQLPSDLNEQMEEIIEEQQDAEEGLTQMDTTASEQQENKKKQTSQSQQRAAEKMKELSKSLENMQMNMEMEQQQENMEHLRDLLDNLLTLSINQESLMKEFEQVRQGDPRTIKLGQEQLKLKDDSKIINDSLIALSQRVFQISSFVTRELREVNRNMDGAITSLKEKRINEVVGKQQFTMTSINNLALLLDDVLENMQNQMANATGKGKGSQKNTPQQGGLSEMQRQLSDQIEELKESGKSGRALSEELAKLAAQQERIRNALENTETGREGQSLGNKIEEVTKQMEQNEWDLINKNISEGTLKRQNEILTRLLDAENSMREQGEKQEREAQTARQYELSIPESLNEYMKKKELEIQLLKTIPAKLNPYYTREANKYFKKIKEKN